MKTGAFVIHLEKAHSRRENVKQLISKCPIPACIHPAVDGTTLTNHEIDQVYRRNLHEPSYPFTLNEGEIGVFLSYRAVWERMLEMKLDVALFIEDDVYINIDIFNHAYTLANRHIKKLGYIKFPIKYRKYNFRYIDSDNSILLCEQQVIPLGAQCQLVSSEAAIKLLEKTDCFDRPVDTFQQLRHITGQRIYSIYPNGISEISAQLSGSIIHKSGNSVDMVSREWKRYKYRSTVNNISAKSFNLIITK